MKRIRPMNNTTIDTLFGDVRVLPSKQRGRHILVTGGAGFVGVASL